MADFHKIPLNRAGIYLRYGGQALTFAVVVHTYDRLMTRIGITAHAHHAGILKRGNEFSILSRYNSCSKLMNAVQEMISFLYIAEPCGQIPIDISVQNHEFRADGLSIKCEQVLWCFGTGTST